MHRVMLGLPHLSAWECIWTLRQLGFQTREQSAEHVTLEREGIVVVVPRAATLGPALVASIVRAAGIEPLDFLRALGDPEKLPPAAESAPGATVPPRP